MTKPRVRVVVAQGDEQSCIRDIIVPYGIRKADGVVTGGRTRQESVFNGLRRVAPNTDMVIIHDCARPFITERMIEDTLEAAGKWGSATVAVPVKDTIKEVNDDIFVVKTLDRQKLWSIQTPQSFKYNFSSL